jgi:hypothetical protein
MHFLSWNSAAAAAAAAAASVYYARHKRALMCCNTDGLVLRSQKTKGALLEATTESIMKRRNNHGMKTVNKENNSSFSGIKQLTVWYI